MLKIEDTEIKTWDKLLKSTSECIIKKNVFQCQHNEETLFNSDIYKYNDVNVLVNRENRFGDLYYNIVVCCEDTGKAWPLATLSTRLDISLKRFNKNLFFLWSDSKDPELDKYTKQCSFFALHSNEKIDNVTVDFNWLKEMVFLPYNYVLIACSQVLGGTGGVDKKIINSLVLYEPTGKLVKTFYEYYEGDEKTFTYEILANTLEINISEVAPKTKKKSEKFALLEFCTATIAEEDL